ncbi:hypothetical protein CKO25_18730 [Thiocapsa imhoffii]|uniref:cyclic-guanylate-specific phosphodiesterase n=1 Tax=Thiocapsa imhoffii TaxID=382777 RepID=A0A9X0WKX2_9GAMM|nr:EAL domain-containing protein [Thiocapsa imhoffii]MBK1646636.1 hypothetical protein [Thiocapsa imhoffii]
MTSDRTPRPPAQPLGSSGATDQPPTPAPASEVPESDLRAPAPPGEDQQGEQDPLTRLRARATEALVNGLIERADDLVSEANEEALGLTGLVENLRIYQAELEIQNEELQVSQQTSEDALIRFAAFFNDLPLPAIVIDQQGLILEANQRSRACFDLRDRVGHAYFFARLIGNPDRGRVIHAWSRLGSGHALELAEVTFNTASGEDFIGDLHIARLHALAHETPRFVCVLVDRTEAVRKAEALARTAERLRASEEAYRVVAEFSPDWDYWLTPDGQFRYVSPACELLTGYPAEAFLADPRLFETLLHPADRARWQAHYDLVTAHPCDDQQRLELALIDARGQMRWIEHVCRGVVDDKGRFLGRRGVNRDITERRRVTEALERSERFLNATGQIAKVGGWELEVATQAVRWTEVTYQIHDLPESAPVPFEEALDYYHPSDRQLLAQHLERATTLGDPFDLQLRMTTAKGREIWVQATCEPVREGQTVVKLQGTVQDISHRKEAEAQLDYLAHHDPLTNLANRSLFHARLELCLQRAARFGAQIGLLFIDLDRFKSVNDTLGHFVGDQLLQVVSSALAAQIRASDTIARLGGDEFVVIMDDLVKPRFAARLARRLLGTLEQPFTIENRELYITASIGISIYPNDGTEMQSLLRHADIAMYRAKEHGRNHYCFYTPEMSVGAVERLRLENALRGAVARHELHLHFQPQVGLRDGQLTGAEALCRWEHPEFGSVSPEQFIPIAEEIGLIGELSTWVLHTACTQLMHWDEAGFRLARLAVNLPMNEIEKADLVERVQHVLRRTGLEASRLELEITESMIMRRLDVAITTLQALHELGVTLALDDFGTGHSSLSHLKRLRVDRLKIDRSFVARLDDDPRDVAITRTAIALGHSLGLVVIAEGIESQAQFEILHREGCDEGQGYFFGKPCSAGAFFAHWSQQPIRADR